MEAKKPQHITSRIKKEKKMIFVSSGVESVARKQNILSVEMYQRMKRVGPIDGFILKCYEGLHTQSRQHATEDVLDALDIWEKRKGYTKRETYGLI